MAVTTAKRPAASKMAQTVPSVRSTSRGPPRKSRQHAPPLAGLIQTKFALGPSNDRFEVQADRAASHVLGGQSGAPSISAIPHGVHAGGGNAIAQRACTACEEQKETRHIQRKCACGAAQGDSCSCKKKEEEHPELQIDRQSKSESTSTENAIGAVESVIKSPGKPLPDQVRNDMETGFGRSFSQVRIHDSSRAAASAEGIGAHAYTVGNHIAFNSGRFQPETHSGRFLLAHELAHTVQQSGAPSARPGRISQPSDRHEKQADRAANAAVTGAPMPGLNASAAQISRYSFSEFVGDAAEVGFTAAAGPVAGYLLGDEVNDLAEDTADAVIDASSAIYRTAVEIARAVGGAISLDGATIVIDVPSFDPCPQFGFDLSLSDIGIEPTLYFPIAAGGFTVGIVTMLGVLGVEAALDPGFGVNLDGCTFGPGHIRISPFSGSATVSGMYSVTAASMVSLGADLGLAADLVGIITVPSAPPIVLAVPLVGLSFGGTMAMMLQGGGTLTNMFTATVGIGGVSASTLLDADLGFSADLAYGLFGSLRILGMELCRVGWPLGSFHKDFAANFKLGTSVSLSTSGLSFSMLASAKPIGTNPLDNLGFAFDQSRMEDDCWLCEFLLEHKLLPQYHGYNWASHLGSLPVLPGPRSGIFKRDPGLASGALCRGTCGINCAPESCDKNQRDLVICRNVGDHHVWHTYENYATCGAHQGCKDHDACYDMAATMPIWGFGGYMIGPMYRACDLDAMCHYSFKQAVGWAGGGGPYSERLKYADRHYITPGCLGPCPENVAEEGEPEVQQTCLTDRELWSGLQVGDSWEKEFFNQNLFSGFVTVPYIVGVHYGVNAAARADADASAELGPINLQNACLIYDPATKTYSGTADLNLFLNGRASASITASLEGFLSDFLCLFNWVTIRGTMNAGVTVQLPTNLTAGVDLFCANGDLMVIPRVSIEPCIDIFGQVRAGIDVFLLSINVWGQEWPLIEKHIEQCWEIGLKFDPFVVGQMPNFDLETRLLQLDSLLGELFEPANPREIDRTPARNPLPGARLLFPCLDAGDDDDDSGGETPPPPNCPNKATGQDGRDHLTAAQLQPQWSNAATMSIPGGGSAGVGTVMEAEFLQKEITGGSRPSVQGAIYGHRGIPTEGCFDKPKKDSQRFVRGHLLNENIGGPGNDVRNLFPITGSANGDHKKRVEQGGINVVAKVRADELIYYKVSVTNPSAPIEIMDSNGAGMGFFEVRATFLCEIADYQFCSDNTFRRNQITRVPIPSQFLFHPPQGQPFDQITDPSKCAN